jgi:crotonobetainyl-CoA:carnitine CoA-transferase CaiB-like acyl-CoA transferase
VYPTKDGKYAVIAANGDAIVQRLLKLIGRGDLLDDGVFPATNSASSTWSSSTA